MQNLNFITNSDQYGSQPWSILYKHCKSETRINTNVYSEIFRADGTVTSTTREAGDLLLNFFFGEDDDSNDSAKQNELRHTAFQPYHSYFDQRFTSSELKHCTKNQN